MSRNEGKEEEGTLGMNGFLVFESPLLVKSDSGERGHVCLLG